jgi:branched-chain amino acid transport system substrate-binding protein
MPDDDARLSRKRLLGAAGTGLVAVGSLGAAGAAAGVRTQSRPKTVERPRTAASIAASKSIVIGCPFPLSGPYAADGQQMQNGSGLAIAEINAAGGIAGRKISRIVLDTNVATPEGVTTSFQKLVSSHVDAILVGYVQVDAPTYDISAAYGAPYIHGNTLQEGVQRVIANPKKYYNIFNVDSTEVHYGYNMPLFINFLEKSGRFRPKSKTVHFIQGDLAYSQNISKAGQQAFKAAGWKIVGVEKVVTPVTDWTPVIGKLHSQPASVVMNCHPAPADLAAFAKQFAANPINALVYLQYGPSIPVFLQLAGPAANGIVWSTVIGTYNDAVGKAFQAKYAAKYHSAPGFANAGQCYDEVYMLASAWGMVGDSRNFKAVCNVLRTQIHRGVSGSYWLNRPGQYNRLYPFETRDPSLGNAHVFYQIQKGKQTIIFPDLYAGAPYRKAPWQK